MVCLHVSEVVVPETIQLKVVPRWAAQPQETDR